GFLVKSVKAIPGDRLGLAEQPGGSHILVNGEILVNSEGEPYLLPEHKAAMIGLYIRDYAGVIPDGAYLVLGNLVRGSTDSTIFGLVDAGRIKGKVLTE
ncbi:MAG: S26 family signal peptidase, partial [Patescibacteria group bacterium]|nr:S26 family signal peptidase [Patescibacteria group bacterium]